MTDIDQATVKELLGMAIRAEIDANKIYSDLASRVSNSLLKEKFQMLAFEEKKHWNILENLHKAILKNQDIQIPEKTDEALLPAIEMTPSSPLIDIIYQAMEAERSAEQFYLRLAEKVQETQKRILEYLSKVEHSHYMMLKSEYTLAQEFADYGEMDIDKVVT